MIKVNREITHPDHPHHRLQLEYTEVPFDCHGCKEAGMGLKYRCQQCKYELHKACGSAQKTITHPFYKKCMFEIYYQPPDRNHRICDACHGDISGFVYHCNCCDFDLHPCCVNLPQVLSDGKNTLYLCMSLSSSCHHCGGKGRGWGYRSAQSKGYNLHVWCVKKLLVERWLALYFNIDNNKVRDLQTLIPRLNGPPRNGSGDGVKKYAQMAGGAARLVISALLGDPTAVIAGVVQGFISM